MEVVHARCAGLDVHKRAVVACVLTPGAAGTVERVTETVSTMLGGPGAAGRVAGRAVG